MHNSLYPDANKVHLFAQRASKNIHTSTSDNMLRHMIPRHSITLTPVDQYIDNQTFTFIISTQCTTVVLCLAPKNQQSHFLRLSFSCLISALAMLPTIVRNREISEREAVSGGKLKLLERRNAPEPRRPTTRSAHMEPTKTIC